MAHIAQILLATDLTDRSWPALIRAIQLKRATAAGLTLLHVAESGGAAAMVALEDLLSRAAGGRLLRRVFVKVALGDPVAEIIAEADARSADLIVLGEPGPHRTRELFLGTTAERVVRHSRRPVLVAKVQSDQPYQRVLVAFDRSEAARRALSTALALAPRAEFRLVHAGQGAAPVRANDDAKPMQRELEDVAGEVMRRSLYPHAKLAVEVREGTPVAALMSAQADVRPDLFVMGTHGRGRLETAVFGSVAQQLLAASLCDALVVPPMLQ